MSKLADTHFATAGPGRASGEGVPLAFGGAVDQLQPGSYLKLTNAKVDMFKGCMRLVVQPQGSIEPSTVKPFEPKVILQRNECLR